MTLKEMLELPSLLDDSPAVEWLTGLLREPRFVNGYKRDFTIAATNLATGTYDLFTRDNVEFGRELATAAMCSSSIPGVFQPRYFKGNWYIDGGVVWNVNISSGVEGCLSKGYTQEQIVVDVLICGAPTPPDVQEKTGNSIDEFLRGRQLKKWFVNGDSISGQMRAYPKVNYRYLFN
jgi:predicted acylesterase/phospholipase RssA